MAHVERKLRIAHVAPVYKPIPAEGYGGTERCVTTLTEQLMSRGHEVTLFASGSSTIDAKIVPAAEKSLDEYGDQPLFRSQLIAARNVANAYNRQGEYDVFLDHTTYVSLPTANLSRTPVIHPLHVPINDLNKPLFLSCNKVNHVAISHAQVRDHPDLPVAATIYHGLQMEHFPFSEQPRADKFLLNVGRIDPVKGTDLAIEVARQLDMPLIIAAKLDRSSEACQEFFEKKVRPHIDDRNVVWVGEVNEDERNKLMSQATALIHPVRWAEPFGLVLIEAMGCGCPAVGLDNGSLREVISHGISGFIAQDIAGMVSAIKDIDKIDRGVCRRYALDNFNADKMTSEYEQLFYRLVEDQASLE